MIIIYSPQRTCDGVQRRTTQNATVWSLLLTQVPAPRVVIADVNQAWPKPHVILSRTPVPRTPQGTLHALLTVEPFWNTVKSHTRHLGHSSSPLSRTNAHNCLNGRQLQTCKIYSCLALKVALKRRCRLEITSDSSRSPRYCCHSSSTAFCSLLTISNTR